MQLILPDRYEDLLGGAENTEKAIKAVKDMFQNNLSAQPAPDDNHNQKNPPGRPSANP